MLVTPTLNKPQAKFMVMPNKFRAYVAGFGGGKTWVGSSAMCARFFKNPKVKQGYFAPTYPHIRDIFFPTIEEVGYEHGLTIDIKEANKEVHFYNGRKYIGTTICRSMDKPGSIVGFKIGDGMADEIDLLTKKKALLAWRKIIARLRYKDSSVRNGLDVTTTPEGFNFVYQQFVKDIRDKPEKAKNYGIIQASTYDNENNLPADYIDSLLETYPEELINAYLNGQFINLSSGTVYKTYDRALNRTKAVIEGSEPLWIGMDFNVENMSAVVHVIRDGIPMALDEIIKVVDTPAIIQKIKEKYWKHDGNDYIKSRRIIIFPDSTGGNRKSVNASETDISLLKTAGFMVDAPKANPPVKDRVNSMKAMFCNAKGVRRYLVNDLMCPTYADDLEQQVWDNGEPDKKNGNDHRPDAGGYFIHRKFPINRSTAIQGRM